MSLVPAFTSSQMWGLPSNIILEDTSTGSDVLIVGRRVYLRQGDGSYLVPSGTTTNYIEWSYSDPSISIDVLQRDMALSVRVDWVNVSGTALYTSTSPYCFTLYTEEFDYGLTQNQVADNSITQDTNYYSNRGILTTELDAAQKAVLRAGDIVSSQNALNRCYVMTSNSKYFF